MGAAARAAGQAEAFGNLRVGQALGAPQSNGALDLARITALRAADGARAAIEQAGGTFGAKAASPLACGVSADAGRLGCRHQANAFNLIDQMRSPFGCQ